MNSINKTARIAGALYFIYIAITILADASCTNLIVFGDAIATANNILVSEQLFRINKSLSKFMSVNSKWTRMRSN